MERMNLNSITGLRISIRDELLFATTTRLTGNFKSIKLSLFEEL